MNTGQNTSLAGMKSVDRKTCQECCEIYKNDDPQFVRMCLWFQFFCCIFTFVQSHFKFYQFQFHIFSHIKIHIQSTHLAVVIGHSEQGNGAVGVAAVADRGHVSVPHDGHGGQRLARGVWMLNGVALPGRRGQLGAQRQVLLDLLILRLVEVELGVLQVAVYLQQKQIIHKYC